MTRRDIHNFERRLELVEASLVRAKICRQDLKSISEFRDQMFADSLGLPRVVKYLQSIKGLAVRTPRGLYRASRKDVITLLAKVERSSWKPWTKHDYKLALRKYLIFLERDDLAELVRLPKVHGYKLPEELLDSQDILALLDQSRSDHDRAFLYTLYETGARIGELLGLERRHVRFDAQGAVMIVEGKTGMRRLRIIESASALDLWISSRSYKPQDLIFPNTYRAYRKRISVLAARAALDKRVYPHLFRHSRATFLACYITEAQLCSYMGWSIGSAMPRIYVHLAGADLDAALSRVPPLMPHALQPLQPRASPAKNR